ncbi:hypothetical protein GCM10027280_61210 [Micromonospora polyrhachis]|uniref:Uncharacterized protein n=1 Tax=Micromonospora polyrhachis TaxID=1282883 RepID=A0A7W7SN62_9ACTN|nr:hypothetical protein [Micromonospora polyrhachis]MBB4957850.1 hypothetical protein [Micromonospora polyrhachis]
MTTPRWVLHLPTKLTSLDEATALTERLREALSHVAVIDFNAATLSEKDRLMVRHQVFCGSALPGQGCCTLRHEHPGPCAAPSDARQVAG